jgi:hypothetical protein
MFFAKKIDTVFDSLAQARPDALVGPGPFLNSHRDLLILKSGAISFSKSSHLFIIDASNTPKPSNIPTGAW